MVPPHDNPSTERRKQVRLRARPNLQVEPRFEGGRRVYVIKDPVSLQYFHFEEGQHFALERMDGQHSLEQIQQEYEALYSPRRLPLEELESFASQLLHCGLAQNEAGGAGRLLFQRYEKQQRWKYLQFLGQLLYFKIPLLQPNTILDKLVPLGRALFHPLVVLGALLFVCAGVGLIVTRWNEFLHRLPELQDLFTWQQVLYLWLALGIVKILHELGHALCTRTLGGDVQELGIVIMFGMPTLYCNVSDSWLLPQRWKRMAIAAAGMYVELILAAAATFVWWSADPATFLHNLGFWTMVVCGVHTFVFNANPLLRFDGYFILSDWMEVPNLAQAAQRCCVQGFLRWLGIDIPAQPAPASRGFLWLYGIASVVYRAFVLGCMLYLFYGFMKERRLEWIGASLVLCVIAILAVMPVYRFVQALRRLGKLPEMKRTRVAIVLVAGAAVVAVVFLVPFRTSVHGMAMVQVDSPSQYSVAIPAPGGFLEQVWIRDGQCVRRGDILAVLKNPPLELERRLNEAELALRVEQSQALTNQLALPEATALPTQDLGEIQQEMRSLAQQSATLRARAEALVLRAPCDGVVMGFPSWETQGKWLQEGTQLCRVGDANKLRVLVLVEPADRQLVDDDKPARFHCHGAGATIWTGTVAGVSPVDADEIPPQLSHRLGGDVVTTKDPVNQTEKPRQQHFLVSVRLDDPDARLQVGALGQVRIDVGAGTLWWRFRRYLGTTFNWGL